MTEDELGELEEVELREIWPNEALDFTPWLASEGLELLSETIGIDISFIKTEAKIGKFSVDILCNEMGTNKKVIIENQLGITDHNHLGKLITYSAGADASIVIWVFKEIREEYIRAIDWLNEITNEDISFYALEIKLYKIDGSNPAPKFELICRPNKWSKAIIQEITGIKMQQREFWSKLKEYENEKRGDNNHFSKTPLLQNWYEISTGYHDVLIIFYINTLLQEVRCEFQISDKLLYEYLLTNNRIDIDSKLNKLGQAEWREKKKTCIIKLKKGGFDIDDETKFESYLDWFVQVEELFRIIILPYIKKYKDDVNPK